LKEVRDMKKATQQLKKVALVVTMAGLSTSLYAVDTADGTATATVVAPITVAENTAMSFGDIAVGVGGGTVVLANTGGGRTPSGDVEVLATTAGTSAVFDVTGLNGATYSISYTQDAILSDGSGNSMTALATSFTDSNSGTGSIGAAGDSFSVGATLTVTGGQAPGSYSTANVGGQPYQVTVNYN
jgi:hypothetical protein